MQTYRFHWFRSQLFCFHFRQNRGCFGCPHRPYTPSLCHCTLYFLLGCSDGFLSWSKKERVNKSDIATQTTKNKSLSTLTTNHGRIDHPYCLLGTFGFCFLQSRLRIGHSGGGGRTSIHQPLLHLPFTFIDRLFRTNSSFVQHFNRFLIGTGLGVPQFCRGLIKKSTKK